MCIRDSGGTSATSSADQFVISVNSIDTPVITPASGLYTGSVTITMSTSTSGATVMYTTNGAGLTNYTTPFTASTTSTIAAYAAKGGMTDSSTATSMFTIRAETPVITPVSGSYVGSVSVTIITSTSGATIMYTVNGAGLTVYSGTITASATSTIAAYAVKGGLVDSATSTSTFTIEAETLSVSVRDQSDSADYTTWALGTLTESAVRIMDGTSCVLVKNSGNVAVDFSLSVSGTNWSFGSAVGIDVCTVMALFNGNTAPIAGAFSTANDLVTGTEVWSTVDSGSGKYEGLESGVNVNPSVGKKLYVYLKTPKFATKSDQETTTITVGCKKH